MTATPETRALLLLARACLARPKVALWQASAAVEHVGSAQRVLAADFAPATQWEMEVAEAARDFSGELPEAERALDEQLHEWAEQGLRLTTVLDPDYPLNLRFVYDRPPFLFYRGELRLDDSYALAVVGTRRPSDEGRKRARRMARLLCERDVTVLSGLAAGIDAEAHTAALEAGGRTVAVLGHGFGRPVYPKENAALAEEIAERGAVVSQFFPGTPPTRRTFPLRNVVTSGMGQGTCVIEASQTSGARLQARLAIEHGKQAFLLQSLLDEFPWAREFAQREGARVVTDVDEVVAHLRKPEEMARDWSEHRASIVAANAEPPLYVQKRLSKVAVKGQQQLSLGT